MKCFAYKSNFIKTKQQIKFMPSVSTQTHSDSVLQNNVTVQVDYRSIICETMSDTSRNEWDTHSSSQSADGRHYDSENECDSEENEEEELEKDVKEEEEEEVKKTENIETDFLYEIREYDQCTTTVETDSKTLRCQNYKSYATQVCSDCKRGRPFIEYDSPPKKK